MKLQRTTASDRLTDLHAAVGIDRMFGLGVPELIIILVVVLLIFGPRKLPELGSFVGKSLKDFREALETRGDDDTEPPPVARGSADKPAEPDDRDSKA